MPPVPEAAFRELLADCSRSEFADFVADLWVARGRPVSREGDRLLVDGDAELRPVVDPEWGDLAPDDDLVVVAAVEAPPAAPDAVVGPAELRRVLLYDVPRERAAELFERHFDEPLAGEWSGRSDPGATGGQRTATVTDALAGDAGRPLAVESRFAVLATGVLLVALVGLLATGALHADPGPTDTVVSPTVTDAGQPGDSGRAGSATPTASGTIPATATPFHRGSVSPTATVAESYPPGLGPDGVSSARRLADTHAGAVSGRSYELVLVYREYGEGRQLGVVREVVQVADRRTYVTELSRTGGVLSTPAAVSSTEAYANGSVRYERRVDGGDVEYVARDRAVGDDDGFADRVGSMVASRLGAGWTLVVGNYHEAGTRFYVVGFRSDEAVGNAIVDEHGVVHSLTWQYTPEDYPRVTAEVTLRYDFENVTVEPPTWLGAARNATEP
jgi:hypothetical protein